MDDDLKPKNSAGPLAKLDENGQPKSASAIELLFAGGAKSADKVLTLGGYAFFMVSAFALVVECYLHFTGRYTFDVTGVPGHEPDGWKVLSVFGPHLILLGASILGAIIGYALLRAAGSASKEVIPQKDAPLLYELLRGDRTTGLDNYVKLASLSGIVGSCFKLGITGLPLATIFLTVFFAILGVIPNDIGKGFLDLSKLTLGAFIGSFVQRARISFDDNSSKNILPPSTPTPPNPASATSPSSNSPQAEVIPVSADGHV
jgi:hypothetical protein